MARRQVGYLHASATEERVRGNQESVWPLARKNFEGGVDIPAVAGVEDLNAQSHGAGSKVHVSQRCLRVSTSWPEQHGNARSSRYQLTEKFQALCSQLRVQKIDTRQVAVWAADARN